jgi:fatty acid desaturase
MGSIVMKFRQNQTYLNVYHMKAVTILLLVNSLLFYLRPVGYEIIYFGPAILFLWSVDIKKVAFSVPCAAVAAVFLYDFHWFYTIGLFAALAIVVPISSLLHNASHNSMRPIWLNRFVGEAVGLFQLAPFPSWVIIHMVHHAHPDDPILDPHPPGDKTYWQFLNGMRATVSKVFMNYYFDLWKNSKNTKNTLVQLMIFGKLDTFLRILFWYQVFGPRWFAFFYCPSVVLKMVMYAFFNYATHPNVDGMHLIVNSNRGFFRFLNFLGFGLFYHKNHHSNPTLFDPRNLAESHSLLESA